MPLTSLVAALTVQTTANVIPVLTWQGNPHMTMSVTWRSKSARIENVTYWSGATQKAVRPTPTKVTLPSGAVWHYFTARLSGLTPGQNYRYRVGSSPTFQFRTVQRGNRVKFLYFGDVQAEIHHKWPLMIKKAFQVCPDAAFMIFAGDLVDSAHDDVQWSDFFRPGGQYFGRIPTIASPGNHEYKSVKPREIASLSFHWKPQWDYALNGFPGLDEQSYQVELNGLRMVSLNSNRFVKDQAVWFDKLMKSNRSPWTVVTYHHPIFSHARGRDNKLVRLSWDPVFRNNNVALALQGHDHVYGRRTAKRLDGRGASVYVVANAGTKFYRLSDEAKKLADVAFERVPTFQVVEIQGKELKYTSYDLGGAVRDQFKMVKNSDGTNRVINL